MGRGGGMRRGLPLELLRTSKNFLEVLRSSKNFFLMFLELLRSSKNMENVVLRTS